jgi:hypothetical protein
VCCHQGSRGAGGHCRSQNTGRSKHGLRDAVVGAQIHLLVFDAAPEPLDKHVVAPGDFAVHADGYAIAGERAGEGLASELRALVGVEYLRLAVARQGVLQRLDAAPLKSGRQSWNPLPLLVSGGRYLSTSLALSMPA